MIKPGLSHTHDSKKLGKIVIGTVAGDLHDIGKNLVTFMLDVNGFEVYDLGVDVRPQTFVDKIREVHPQIVGLSGFLTSVYQTMKDTVDAITAAGLRNEVNIMIGGGVMDDEIKEFAGADAYGQDAMTAVNLAGEWLGGA
jgi:5-methyltetrahydrofolate--homocysteine methyltransferase